MPEPPDFDRLAHEVMKAIDGPLAFRAIREQLRQVWNARGQADHAAVDDRLATLTGWVTSEPYRNHLREAIAALDRPS